MNKDVKLGSSDQLFPYTVLKIFGDIPGLSGICIAGVFGSSLGTLSSAANTLAAVTVEDFIKTYCFFNKISDVWMSFIAKIVGEGTLIGLFVGFTIYAWMSIGSYLTKADFKTLPRSTEGCPANSSLEFLNAIQGSLPLNITKPVIPLEEEKYIFPVYRCSFMWYPVITFVIVLLVGYSASFIISFWFNAPKVKPESLSSIVRKLYFKPAKSVDETKGVGSELTCSYLIVRLKKAHRMMEMFLGIRGSMNGTHSQLIIKAVENFAIKMALKHWHP
ncbi:sodium-dependent multivitamin transporter [Caerostris darwini]|uniref:Sodium-dependent multivitamin transporter n=1 Tax=Caerostris darwini TaxID=1538125 RepID=A0AAV4N311_9ARAC|nr:sodium-dependent multivitamin transporter [Caerostris darwini]